MLKQLKQKKFIKFLIILFLGFLVRVLFVKQGLRGDVTAFAEWGERFWHLEMTNFYFDEGWYYTFPTYPPLSNLLFAGLNWLNQHAYVLSQIHNTIKIIPASFIIFFGEIVPGHPFMYRYGYFLLLKLVPILSDLAVSLLIFKTVLLITKKEKLAWGGMFFYLFNPVTIFLSGVWGQTESLVTFFGLASFLLLYHKKFHFSLPLFFTGLYLKPTWVVVLPLYLIVLYFYRPKIRHFFYGVLISIGIYLVCTLPFSPGNIISFTKEIVLGNILPGAKGIAKASNSAFNFHTIFLDIDIDLASKKILGIPSNFIGYTAYLLFNIFAYKLIKKEKKEKLLAIMVSLFTVAMGSYLFMTSMLERYFFVSFAPLVILLAVKPKLAKPIIIMNLILFANLFWSFYRRGWDELDRPFTNNNFLVIRLLSAAMVVSWFYLAKKTKFLVNLKN